MKKTDGMPSRGSEVGRTPADFIILPFLYWAFHTAEEICIPLLSKRPLFYTIQPPYSWSYFSGFCSLQTEQIFPASSFLEAELQKSEIIKYEKNGSTTNQLHVE